MGAIILIERDSDRGLSAQRALTASVPGSICLSAADGAEAIKCSQDHDVRARLRLVLLCLQSLDASGFELLDELALCEDLSGVPIVCMASALGPADIRRAYEHGARSLLLKPSAQADCDELLGLAATYWVRMNMCPHGQDETAVRP